MSIREILEKSKSREVYAAAIIVLVAFGSFGLGRLSERMERPRQGVSIERSSANFNEVMSADVSGGSAGNASAGAPGAVAEDGTVVASKSGTKYHYPWCAGARQISVANKITFSSTEEARAAGYLPASNCKGLK